MPARLSLTKAQRDRLLALPNTEEAFVRHYSFSGEDVEIMRRYRTPETRLAFALQLCVLRYPGRVLRQGEVMPLNLLAFIAEQVGVSTDAIDGFARRQQTCARSWGPKGQRRPDATKLPADSPLNWHVHASSKMSDICVPIMH
jgi:TnpA family transposase